jgi:hypothetical protein
VTLALYCEHVQVDVAVATDLLRPFDITAQVIDLDHIVATITYMNILVLVLVEAIVTQRSIRAKDAGIPAIVYTVLSQVAA